MEEGWGAEPAFRAEEKTMGKKKIRRKVVKEDKKIKCC